jgi:hypothetical protein
MPDAPILATADLHEDIDTIVCADDDWPNVKSLSCTVELLKPVPEIKSKDLLAHRLTPNTRTVG